MKTNDIATPSAAAAGPALADQPSAAITPQGNVIPLQRSEAGEMRPRLAIAATGADSAEAATLPRARDLLTINLDDQLRGLRPASAAPRREWAHVEKRLGAITLQLLDRLDATDNRATFFVSGWVGDNAADIVREVARRGHEIASSGYYRRSAADMGPEELRSDAVRARIALETASGAEVRGHRVARGWLTLRQLWVLAVLAEEGFTYDSSFCPHGFASWPDVYCRPHSHRFEGRIIHELPLSSPRVLGFRLPISGGPYMRRLPRQIISACIETWRATGASPWLLQFQVCDLETDPTQAALAGSPDPEARPRAVDPIAAYVMDFLDRYRFCSIADYLDGSSTLPTSAAEQALAGKSVPRFSNAR